MTSTSLPSRSAMARDAFCTRDDSSMITGRMLADRQRIAVERCIAELRAARAVLVRLGTSAWLVRAAESEVGTEAFDDYTRSGNLVLPRERLETLGVTVAGAASCYLGVMSRQAMSSLVFAKRAATVPVFTPATVVESAALDLMKFAQVLPAAIVERWDDQASSEWLLDVSVDAIRGYHHEAAHALTIVARAPVPLLDDADAEFVVFRGGDGLKDQVAIVVGKPDPAGAVPIRLHSACLTGDLFGSLKCDCGEQLRRAVKSFADTGGGVLLYLDQEGRGIGMSNKMRAYALQAEGFDTVDADAVLGYGADERRYEIAAQMVALLGYDRVSLLTNNPRKIAALTAQGITVADRIALVGTMNPHNERYLKTKVTRSGHLAECEAQPTE